MSSKFGVRSEEAGCASVRSWIVRLCPRGFARAWAHACYDLAANREVHVTSTTTNEQLNDASGVLTGWVLNLKRLATQLVPQARPA